MVILHQLIVAVMSVKKLCVTCGTEYPMGADPEICQICAEERQYIPRGGQKWSTHIKVRNRHEVEINRIKKGLFELFITPRFGIGQRAFLVLSEQGNVLWDCIPLLDVEIIDFIKAKGGLKAIAFSHPHYYSNMNTWAKTFDCPIYIHEKDKEFVVAPSPYIEYWKGNTMMLWDGLTLLNLGGHFDGGTVLLLPNHSKKGVMLCSDILQISPSRKFIAMMYSYPNLIPLPRKEIKRIKATLDRLSFDTLYGAFLHQNLTKEVHQILDESVKRYFE